MKTYKTFKDLQFKSWSELRGIIAPEPEFIDAEQAVLIFDNGYGVSVLHGEPFYSDENTFELAIVKDNEIVYPKEICNYHEVFGWQTKEQITELMKKVQDLCRQ